MPPSGPAHVDERGGRSVNAAGIQPPQVEVRVACRGSAHPPPLLDPRTLPWFDGAKGCRRAVNKRAAMQRQLSVRRPSARTSLSQTISNYTSYRQSSSGRVSQRPSSHSGESIRPWPIIEVTGERRAPFAVQLGAIGAQAHVAEQVDRQFGQLFGFHRELHAGPFLAWRFDDWKEPEAERHPPRHSAGI